MQPDNSEYNDRNEGQPFCDHIREYFSYLIDEYDFHIASQEERPNSGEIVYRNLRNGVLLRIYFETDGGSCSMGIGRLRKDGKPEKLFSAIDPGGNRIDWEFLNVNDALTYDSPEDHLPPTFLDGTQTGLYLGENAMWEYMEDHALTLQRHGVCLLEGDMKLLPEARKSLVRTLKRDGWKVPGFFQSLKSMLLRDRI